jgi:hypothetical protein
MTKRFICSLLGCAAFCLMIVFMAGNLYAQQGQGQQQMMQQPAAEVQVSDADLEKVATAYQDIHAIRVELQDSLAGVTDPESAQKLQEQASADMVEAVQENGLDVQTYNQIMEAAQTNEDIREKLSAKLQKMQ